MRTIKANEPVQMVDSAFRIETGNYSTLYYSSAGGNCKLCHISDIFYDSKGVIDRIKELVKASKKLCFEVNVDYLETIQTINEHFPIIFCNKVPIGYGGKYTYFALFLTTFLSKSMSASEIKKRLINEKDLIKNFNYECIYKEPEK
jgi:hypothetical protein